MCEYDPYHATVSLFGHLFPEIAGAYDIQNVLVLVSRGLSLIAMNMFTL